MINILPQIPKVLDPHPTVRGAIVIQCRHLWEDRHEINGEATYRDTDGDEWSERFLVSKMRNATITCVKESWVLTPEAREEMRKHDELMAETGFEGALYREQMAEVGEWMKSSMQAHLMERILPRMPQMLCS